MERLTPRLRLRELREEDFDALYAVLGDSDITRHYPYTFDETRVRNWIARNRRRYETLGFGLWAVTLRETGELIGDCGLTLQNINGELLPEIGYHIRRDRQRQGYAAEAARACRDWAFANTPFRQLFSYLKRDNLPSAATARAIGMRHLSDFTDAEEERSSIYAITREEWNALRKNPQKPDLKQGGPL